jgi:tetratricopeptide (TPR) repeat protein
MRIRVLFIIIFAMQSGTIGLCTDVKERETPMSNGYGWADLLPKSTHDKFYYIMLGFRLGEKTGYEKEIREFVALEPNSTVVLTCAAILSSYYCDDHKLGLELANAAVKADPEYARAWEARADVLLHDNKYQEAIDDYTKAIKFGNGDLQAGRYYMRGLAYMKLEPSFVLSKNAIFDIRQARKLKDDPGYMFLEGLVLFRSLQIKESLSLADAYIKRAPNDAQGAILRASSLLVLNRDKEAEEEFARLKKIEPKGADRESAARQLAADAKKEYGGIAD